MEFASLAAFLVVAMVLCLGERGIRAHLARRSGEAGPNRQRPTYALATAVKLLSRRSSRPAFHADLVSRIRARRYPLGSALLITAVLLALATVPVGRDLQVLPSSAGVLVALAALSIAVFGNQLAGETGPDHAHVDALAAARQGVVVLVNVGVLMVGVVMIPGTADLASIVEAQPHLFAWFLWRQPIGLALIVLLILLVHDSQPALSGTRSGVEWLGAVLMRVFLSALVVSLYLGGWSPGLTLPAGAWWALLSLLVFVVKTLLVLYGIIAVGRLLPRFRPDQVEGFAWTMIIPCAVANLLITAAGVTLYQMALSGDAQLAPP